MGEKPKSNDVLQAISDEISCYAYNDSVELNHRRSTQKIGSPYAFVEEMDFILHDNDSITFKIAVFDTAHIANQGVREPTLEDFIMMYGGIAAKRKLAIQGIPTVEFLETVDAKEEDIFNRLETALLGEFCRVYENPIGLLDTNISHLAEMRSKIAEAKHELAK